MSELETIVAYLTVKYPNKSQLSKARLTKLVYLADWFSALTSNKQMTDIKWVFNHYGPYVDDIVNVARESHDFSIKHTLTHFGGDKYLVSYNSTEDKITLDDNKKTILDFVINKTKDMYFDKFIDYVYSTYPVQAKQRYSELDLENLAAEYSNTLPTVK